MQPNGPSLVHCMTTLNQNLNLEISFAIFCSANFSLGQATNSSLEKSVMDYEVNGEV